MDSFYTYAHYLKNSPTPFYIGKGRGSRAYSCHSRSQEWKSFAALGYEVKICATWANEKDAFLHERLLISCFREIGSQLVNKTSGGQGYANPSKEVREKISKSVSKTLDSKRAALSLRQKMQWQDPSYKAMMIAARQPYCDSIKKPKPTAQEIFERKSRASKNKMTPQARLKHSQILKEKWADPEFKAMMLAARIKK